MQNLDLATVAALFWHPPLQAQDIGIAFKHDSSKFWYDIMFSEVLEAVKQGLHDCTGHCVCLASCVPALLTARLHTRACVCQNCVTSSWLFQHREPINTELGMRKGKFA